MDLLKICTAFRHWRQLTVADITVSWSCLTSFLYYSNTGSLHLPLFFNHIFHYFCESLPGIVVFTQDWTKDQNLFNVFRLSEETLRCSSAMIIQCPKLTNIHRSSRHWIETVILSEQNDSYTNCCFELNWLRQTSSAKTVGKIVSGWLSRSTKGTLFSLVAPYVDTSSSFLICTFLLDATSSGNKETNWKKKTSYTVKLTLLYDQENLMDRTKTGSSAILNTEVQGGGSTIECSNLCLRLFLYFHLSVTRRGTVTL